MSSPGLRALFKHVLMSASITHLTARLITHITRRSAANIAGKSIYILSSTLGTGIIKVPVAMPMLFLTAVLDHIPATGVEQTDHLGMKPSVFQQY